MWHINKTFDKNYFKWEFKKGKMYSIKLYILCCSINTKGTQMQINGISRRHILLAYSTMILTYVSRGRSVVAVVCTWFGEPGNGTVQIGFDHRTHSDYNSVDHRSYLSVDLVSIGVLGRLKRNRHPPPYIVLK